MEYKIINSIDELPDFDPNQPVFADIETDDLYGPLRMIQLYQPSTDPLIYILDIAPIGYDKTKYLSDVNGVKDLVMKLHTVWYNSSYDLGTMNISPSMGAKTPDDITKDSKYVHRVDDIFYAVRSAYPEFMEFGLKKIVKRLKYTIGLYDGINTDEAPKGFVRGAYVSTQAYKYGALDVYSLSLMWEDMKIQNIIQNNLAYKVDMMSQSYALIYQQNGLLLDRQMWEEKLVFAKKQVSKYIELLPQGFNPNSYKQVRAYLDIEKSDHDALVAYSLSSVPKAKDGESIIKLKKYKKQVSYLSSIEFDRMYTKFNVAGALTGRFTSSGGSLVDGFNAQQIPKEFQKLFTQKYKDTSVVGLDYATLELRLACGIFGAETMYKQFKDGRDLHTEMACLGSGKKIPPKDFSGKLDSEKGLIDWGEPRHPEYISIAERSEAKSISFGYVFGMSARSYIGYAYTNYGIKVTLQESTKLRDDYFTLYPEIAKGHSYMWNNYKKPSFFVITALGRRVKPKMGTDAINIPIQGTGAECTKLGVHYMVKENPLILKYLFNVVHDATYCRYKDTEIEYWEEMQSRNMIKGWTEISKCPIMKYKDIPMLVE